MTESRLFQIIYHLLDKEEATALELAEKFEVSVRTIYRDIDKLSSAGIPVYSTTGYKGGIHLDKSFVLRKSLLSKEDMQNILMGVQSLSAVGFSQQEDCLAKLRGIFRMQETDWIEVDFSRWGCDPEREKNVFGLLKEAIQQKRHIHFVYYNSQGESSHRECLPMKLIFKDRAWYLQAYCLTRNAERMFRLSRVRDLKVTDRYFERIPVKQPSAFSEAEPLNEDTLAETARIIEMELCFEQRDAYRIYDIFDESMITTADHRLIVKAAMPEDEWLYGFLMSFGNRLTVLSPTYLNDELIRRYQSALEHLSQKSET